MATYVLIPGAGGIAAYWYLVEADLRARGHDVVAVDLPADDDAAGLAEYADAVVAAVGDRSDIILVAQSFAGFTAPLVCDRLPVTMMVLLNAMVPSPGETPGEWWENTGWARARREQSEREGRTPEEDDDMLVTFFHDVPPDVTSEAMTHGREQSATPFGQAWPLDAWPNVPTRFLLSRDDRFFPPDFLRRVVRDRLGITPDEMDGGHLVALSRPKELADQLEEYRIALSDGRGESDFPRGIGRPATGALAAAGYVRLEQLTAVSEADILKLHGVGPKALRILRNTLAERGLSFAGAS